MGCGLDFDALIAEHLFCYLSRSALICTPFLLHSHPHSTLCLSISHSMLCLMICASINQQSKYYLCYFLHHRNLSSFGRWLSVLLSFSKGGVVVASYLQTLALALSVDHHLVSIYLQQIYWYIEYWIYEIVDVFRVESWQSTMRQWLAIALLAPASLFWAGSIERW